MTFISSAEALRPDDDPNTGGVKADLGKARMDLVPPELVFGVAEILGFGANKYGDRNWEKGMKWSRPFGAILRHLYKWWMGESLDPETGKSHLWHVATNVGFLIAYEERGAGEDDRPNVV
jgi:hypothetical protein